MLRDFKWTIDLLQDLVDGSARAARGYKVVLLLAVDGDNLVEDTRLDVDTGRCDSSSWCVMQFHVLWSSMQLSREAKLKGLLDESAAAACARVAVLGECGGKVVLRTGVDGEVEVRVGCLSDEQTRSTLVAGSTSRVA
eukprot:267177-Amphidinium_carterae.1